MKIKSLQDQQIKDFLNQGKFLSAKTIIIGGSKLFHGAPLLSLMAASRFNQTVFFSSPQKEFGQVCPGKKDQLLSFIWTPFSQVENYLASVDAALIGPGFMRYSHQQPSGEFSPKPDNLAGEKTKKITKKLLTKFPNLTWVIDAGSLQVIKKEDLPVGAIITPNNREFKLLFSDQLDSLSLEEQINVVRRRASQTGCLIVSKNPISVIASADDYLVVRGGNKGLEKGGTGDTLAGLVMALVAGSDQPLLAASVAVWLLKNVADKIATKQGHFYNADDLAKEIATLAANCLR